MSQSPSYEAVFANAEAAGQQTVTMSSGDTRSVSPHDYYPDGFEDYDEYSDMVTEELSILSLSHTMNSAVRGETHSRGADPHFLAPHLDRAGHAHHSHDPSMDPHSAHGSLDYTFDPDESVGGYQFDPYFYVSDEEQPNSDHVRPQSPFLMDPSGAALAISPGPDHYDQRPEVMLTPPPPVTGVPHSAGPEFSRSVHGFGQRPLNFGFSHLDHRLHSPPPATPSPPPADLDLAPPRPPNTRSGAVVAAVAPSAAVLDSSMRGVMDVMSMKPDELVAARVESAGMPPVSSSLASLGPSAASASSAGSNESGTNEPQSMLPMGFPTDSVVSPLVPAPSASKGKSLAEDQKQMLQAMMVAANSRQQQHSHLAMAAALQEQSRQRQMMQAAALAAAQNVTPVYFPRDGRSRMKKMPSLVGGLDRSTGNSGLPISRGKTPILTLVPRGLSAGMMSSQPLNSTSLSSSSSSMRMMTEQPMFRNAVYADTFESGGMGAKVRLFMPLPKQRFSLMEHGEIEKVLRTQLHHIMSDDPLNDDFYCQIHNARMGKKFTGFGVPGSGHVYLDNAYSKLTHGDGSSILPAGTLGRTTFASVHAPPSQLLLDTPAITVQSLRKGQQSAIIDPSRALLPGASTDSLRQALARGSAEEAADTSTGDLSMMSASLSRDETQRQMSIMKQQLYLRQRNRQRAEGDESKKEDGELKAPSMSGAKESSETPPPPPMSPYLLYLQITQDLYSVALTIENGFDLVIELESTNSAVYYTHQTSVAASVAFESHLQMMAGPMGRRPTSAPGLGGAAAMPGSTRAERLDRTVALMTVHNNSNNNSSRMTRGGSNIDPHSASTMSGGTMSMNTLRSSVNDERTLHLSQADRKHKRLFAHFVDRRQLAYDLVTQYIGIFSVSAGMERLKNRRQQRRHLKKKFANAIASAAGIHRNPLQSKGMSDSLDEQMAREEKEERRREKLAEREEFDRIEKDLRFAVDLGRVRFEVLSRFQKGRDLLYRVFRNLEPNSKECINMLSLMVANLEWFCGDFVDGIVDERRVTHMIDHLVSTDVSKDRAMYEAKVKKQKGMCTARKCADKGASLADKQFSQDLRMVLLNKNDPRWGWAQELFQSLTNNPQPSAIFDDSSSSSDSSSSEESFDEMKPKQTRDERRSETVTTTTTTVVVGGSLKKEEDNGGEQDPVKEAQKEEGDGEEAEEEAPLSANGPHRSEVGSSVVSLDRRKLKHEERTDLGNSSDSSLLDLADREEEGLIEQVSRSPLRVSSPTDALKPDTSTSVATKSKTESSGPSSSSMTTATSTSTSSSSSSSPSSAAAAHSSGARKKRSQRKKKDSRSLLTLEEKQRSLNLKRKTKLESLWKQELQATRIASENMLFLMNLLAEQLSRIYNRQQQQQQSDESKESILDPKRYIIDLMRSKFVSTLLVVALMKGGLGGAATAIQRDMKRRENAKIDQVILEATASPKPPDSRKGVKKEAESEDSMSMKKMKKKKQQQQCEPLITLSDVHPRWRTVFNRIFALIENDISVFVPPSLKNDWRFYFDSEQDLLKQDKLYGGVVDSAIDNRNSNEELSNLNAKKDGRNRELFAKHNLLPKSLDDYEKESKKKTQLKEYVKPKLKHKSRMMLDQTEKLSGIGKMCSSINLSWELCADIFVVLTKSQRMKFMIEPINQDGQILEKCEQGFWARVRRGMSDFMSARYIAYYNRFVWSELNQFNKRVAREEQRERIRINQENARKYQAWMKTHKPEEWLSLQKHEQETKELAELTAKEQQKSAMMNRLYHGLSVKQIRSEAYTRASKKTKKGAKKRMRMVRSMSPPRIPRSEKLVRSVEEKNGKDTHHVMEDKQQLETQKKREKTDDDDKKSTTQGESAKNSSNHHKNKKVSTSRRKLKIGECTPPTVYSTLPNPPQFWIDYEMDERRSELTLIEEIEIKKKSVQKQREDERQRIRDSMIAKLKARKAEMDKLEAQAAAAAAAAKGQDSVSHSSKGATSSTMGDDSQIRDNNNNDENEMEEGIILDGELSSDDDDDGFRSMDDEDDGDVVPELDQCKETVTHISFTSGKVSERIAPPESEAIRQRVYHHHTPDSVQRTPKSSVDRSGISAQSDPPNSDGPVILPPTPPENDLERSKQSQRPTPDGYPEDPSDGSTGISPLGVIRDRRSKPADSLIGLPQTPPLFGVVNTAVPPPVPPPSRGLKKRNPQKQPLVGSSSSSSSSSSSVLRQLPPKPPMMDSSRASETAAPAIIVDPAVSGVMSGQASRLDIREAMQRMRRRDERMHRHQPRTVGSSAGVSGGTGSLSQADGGIGPPPRGVGRSSDRKRIYHRVSSDGGTRVRRLGGGPSGYGESGGSSSVSSVEQRERATFEMMQAMHDAPVMSAAGVGGSRVMQADHHHHHHHHMTAPSMISDSTLFGTQFDLHSMAETTASVRRLRDGSGSDRPSFVPGLQKHLRSHMVDSATDASVASVTGQSAAATDLSSEGIVTPHGSDHVTLSFPDELGRGPAPIYAMNPESSLKYHSAVQSQRSGGVGAVSGGGSPPGSSVASSRDRGRGRRRYQQHHPHPHHHHPHHHQQSRKSDKKDRRDGPAAAGHGMVKDSRNIPPRMVAASSRRAYHVGRGSHESNNHHNHNQHHRPHHHRSHPTSGDGHSSGIKYRKIGRVRDSSSHHTGQTTVESVIRERERRSRVAGDESAESSRKKDHRKHGGSGGSAKKTRSSDSRGKKSGSSKGPSQAQSSPSSRVSRPSFEKPPRLRQRVADPAMPLADLPFKSPYDEVSSKRRASQNRGRGRGRSGGRGGGSTKRKKQTPKKK